MRKVIAILLVTCIAAFPVATTDLTDLAPSVSGGILTLQPGVHGFGPNVRCVFTTTSTASVNSITGSGGIAEVYLAPTCAIVLVYPIANSITWALGGNPPMTATPSTVPSVPTDSYWIAEATIGSTVTAVTDKRTQSTSYSFRNGLGAKIDYTLGVGLVNVDQTVVPTLSGSNSFKGIVDVSTGVFRSPSGSSDPGCTNVGNDLGKWWLDTTTSTTVVKICKQVAGSLGWSTITTSP